MEEQKLGVVDLGEHKDEWDTETLKQIIRLKDKQIERLEKDLEHANRLANAAYLLLGEMLDEGFR